jgi:hypothetical protein
MAIGRKTLEQTRLGLETARGSAVTRGELEDVLEQLDPEYADFLA